MQKALREHNRELRYTKCLELVARLYGYSSHYEFVQAESCEPLSPLDDQINDTELEARFCFQERVMAEAGFADIAGAVLDAVNPTGRRQPAAIAAE
jgi:hypothetical protein